MTTTPEIRPASDEEIERLREALRMLINRYTKHANYSLGPQDPERHYEVIAARAALSKPEPGR